MKYAQPIFIILCSTPFFYSAVQASRLGLAGTHRTGLMFGVAFLAIGLGLLVYRQRADAGKG